MGELAFFFGMRHLGILTNIYRFNCHNRGNLIHIMDIVSARCHKLTGATCLRLPRDRFTPLLKMFPEEEETIAESALKSIENVRNSHSGGR